MKTTEEILLDKLNQMISLLTEIKETNRQMRNYQLYQEHHVHVIKPLTKAEQKKSDPENLDRLKSILKRQD